jgi:hypothetical protein
MKIRFINILLLAWLFLPACDAQSKQAEFAVAHTAIQADTTTIEEVRQYHALVEMLYDVRLTHAQRAQLRPFVDQYRLGKGQKRQIFDNCLEFYRQLMMKATEERTAHCRQIMPVSLLEQWKLAKTGDAEARLMLDIYYAAHPPLAQGTPHLTRDIVDALIAFDHFFNTTVKGLKTGPIDKPYREKMYKEAINKWKTLDANAQEEMFKSAANVSMLRLKWDNAGPEDRLLIKARAVGEQNLSPAEQQQLAQIQQIQQWQMQQMQAQLGSIQQQQWQLLGNEIQYMRQNQQTIMGNGTYYNQTLRRWEQHGGVVTEFH